MGGFPLEEGQEAGGLALFEEALGCKAGGILLCPPSLDLREWEAIKT
jgi:hypothetical protein